MSQAKPYRADTGEPGLGTSVQSLARGLELMEFVVSAGEPLRLRDIAARLGYDRSTALRLLATLETCGFIAKDPASKLYSQGAKLARLRRFSPARGLLIERMRPYLNRLNEATGMTTYLGVLEQDQATIIEVVPAKHIISVRQMPGDTEPLYRGAVGKSLLANIPEQLQRGMVESMRFQRFTARTITDKQSLLRELREVRASGLAFDEAEGHDDVCCIAAAVLDDSGYPLASIGISMVKAMYPGGARGQATWIEVVRETAFAARRSVVPT
ncbi:IclR family transcriptional regulator [Lichenicoccus sp.]|uniref:IclR family transcriptional regulator n=1 Tax=Lichenicoccus sp. TaxID=2781899 RepID=UPI003D13D4A7